MKTLIENALLGLDQTCQLVHRVIVGFQVELAFKDVLRNPHDQTCNRTCLAVAVQSMVPKVLFKTDPFSLRYKCDHALLIDRLFLVGWKCQFDFSIENAANIGNIFSINMCWCTLMIFLDLALDGEIKQIELPQPVKELNHLKILYLVSMILILYQFLQLRHLQSALFLCDQQFFLQMQTHFLPFLYPNDFTVRKGHKTHSGLVSQIDQSIHIQSSVYLKLLELLQQFTFDQQVLVGLSQK